MPARQPLPLPTTPAVALNRSEWVYVACDGPIGEVNQAYLMRLNAPLEAAQAKAVFRRLISAVPRLRGVLEPTPRRYQLRVLPDDGAMDTLVDLAFRVDHVDLDDPEARRRWQELALNDSMPLERGLSVRMQFAPHPERAALLFTVHHLLADGRSMVLFIEQLMKLLNGLPIDDVPLDSSSMLPAVVPAKWWQWPGKVWTAWQTNRAEARERGRYEIVRLPTKRSARYLSCGVQHHDMGLATKDISRAAKGMGGSGNSLLMAAFGSAILALAGNRPGTAALIRLSVDLRRYYPDGSAPLVGNYVAIFDVLLPNEVPEHERTAWIDGRVRSGLQRFERHEMILPLLPYELLGWLRPHDYTRLINRAKRMDALPRLSCHTTNIGSVDAFNPDSAQVPLGELHPIVAGVAPLVVFVSVGGQQVMVNSNQRDQVDDEQITRLMQEVRQVLHRWVPPTAA